MNAMQWLALALGATEPTGEAHTCGLCGKTAVASPWRDVVKPTFTNIDELQAQHICWACEFVLNDRRSRSSFLLTRDSGLVRVERRQVWPLLLCPPAPPFLLYMTISGKKHGAFRQAVAYSRDLFRVQCESLHCWFAPADNAGWMRACADLVQIGVMRDSIESGRYQSADYRSAGVAMIRQAESLLAPIRPTTLFRIVFGLMPGKADIMEAFR